MGANNSKIVELERRITILEEGRVNTGLQERYDRLYAEHERLLGERIRPERERGASINHAAISKFVDDIINDPEANIYYLPDIAERGLYSNVLKMLLVLLQKSLANLDINLIGHSVNVQLSPVSATESD